MRHDRQQQAGSTSPRYPERKEWTDDADRSTRVPDREQARRPGKTRQAHGILEREAERQIRELRARY